MVTKQTNWESGRALTARHCYDRFVPDELWIEVATEHMGGFDKSVVQKIRDACEEIGKQRGYVLLLRTCSFVGARALDDRRGQAEPLPRYPIVMLVISRPCGNRCLQASMPFASGPSPFCAGTVMATWSPGGGTL